MNYKFNSNYEYNSKHNMPKIRKIVRHFKEEPVNPRSLDFIFRYNARNYPRATHKELELPGEFKQIEDTAVFVMDNGVLQMDHAESVTPDGGIVERDAANDVEHQTGKLRQDKVEKIFEYCLTLQSNLKNHAIQLLSQTMITARNMRIILLKDSLLGYTSEYSIRRKYTNP